MEASQLNISVLSPGKGEKYEVDQYLTYENLVEWIRLQGYEEPVAKALIRKAAAYPTGALPDFKKRIMYHLAAVKTKSSILH